MKVAIQCNQCKRSTTVEEERLRNKDKKRWRCRQCGAFFDEEAIKEALSNSTRDNR